MRPLSDERTCNKRSNNAHSRTPIRNGAPRIYLIASLWYAAAGLYLGPFEKLLRDLKLATFYGIWR